jgi:beta-lactamase superfamily II metal-dependent hydrolase
MLAADTNYRPWREKILPYYSDKNLHAPLLIAAHHGSITFFDDPSDTEHYYETHIRMLRPDMTLISVGPNAHGLPDTKAVEIYNKHSKGSKKGTKVYTTEDKRNIKITLNDDGTWSLNANQ